MHETTEDAILQATDAEGCLTPEESAAPSDDEADTEATEEMPATVPTSGTEAEGEHEEGTPPQDPPAPDYEEMARLDLLTLQAAFPETRGLRDLREITNLKSFAAFRAAGHPARVAYLLSREAEAPAKATYDTRETYTGKEHLVSGVAPHGSFSTGGRMSYREMAAARELFSDLTPRELLSLYRRAKG